MNSFHAKALAVRGVSVRNKGKHTPGVDGNHGRPPNPGWGLRKHRRKGRGWAEGRHRHPRGDRKWSFCSDKERLFNPTEVKIRRRVKVIDTGNPCVDTGNLLERQKSRRYERGCRDRGFAM